jgi:hypothetical protein
MRPARDNEVADITALGMPMRLETAQEYFRMKGLAHWGARVALASWDTWEGLGDRLGARLGHHIWHPVHWEERPPRSD